MRVAKKRIRTPMTGKILFDGGILSDDRSGILIKIAGP
jgi:hypothetical protein